MKQHKRAQLLLPLIVSAHKNSKTLTYQIGAEKIDLDPKRQARAIAHVCDLLDAAATLAKLPLLALYVVRNSDGNINPQAFRQDILAREKIIYCSENYTFSDTDFESIKHSLQELIELGYGNTKAWRYVNDELGDAVWVSLIGSPLETYSNDAIDDFGTDHPHRVLSTSASYPRDPKVREAVRKRARGKCELCDTEGFEKPNGERFIETHHIIALANDGADRVTNVIALCPNHHREAHFGKRYEELEKEMMKVVQELTKQ